MVLVAIVVQFITMFIGVQDTDNFIGITGISGGTFYPHTPDLTGAQVHPQAPIILIGLFLMYATVLYHLPLWKRFGYIFTVVVMFVFTTGGAAFRVFGGFISFASWILVCVAAFKHHRQKKAKEVGENSDLKLSNSIYDPTDSADNNDGSEKKTSESPPLPIHPKATVPPPLPVHQKVAVPPPLPSHPKEAAVPPPLPRHPKEGSVAPPLPAHPKVAEPPPLPGHHHSLEEGITEAVSTIRNFSKAVSSEEDEEVRRSRLAKRRRALLHPEANPESQKVDNSFFEERSE